MALQQILVTGQRGLGAQRDAAFFGEQVISFGDDAADEVAFPEICVIGLELAPGEGLEDAVLEHLDVFLGRLLGKEGVDGDHHIALGHEPGGMLFALLIYEIGTQEALADVIDPPGDFSRREQDMPGGIGLGDQLFAYALLEGCGQGRDVAQNVQHFFGIVE